MTRISEHFCRSEFKCSCGCGFDTVDSETLKLLEAIRAHFGAPVHINSGCRCQKYNAKIGGAKRSQHLLGRAADIWLTGVESSLVADFAAEYLVGKLHVFGGIGRYDGFTHVDTRSGKAARWRC